MQAAQAVQEPLDLELPGVIAQQRFADEQVVMHQRADDRRFGGDPPRFIPADFPGHLLPLPGLIAGNDPVPLLYRTG